MQPGSAWRNPGPAPLRHNPQRQPFNAMADRSFRTNTTGSDHSNSAGEVERLLAPAAQHSMRTSDRSWSAPQGRLGVPAQRGLSCTLIYLRSAQMTLQQLSHNQRDVPVELLNPRQSGDTVPVVLRQQSDHVYIILVPVRCWSSL